MSLLLADARAIPLADGCVQCVVTSPPYWGLRDYGTATWAGGDADCDHQGPPQRTMAQCNENTNGGNSIKVPRMAYREVCGKCGARRVDSQIGLEQTPDAYVAELVAVFREVRRVLRDDGVVFLNLGDSYANTGKSGGGAQGKRWESHGGRTDDCAGTFKYAPPGLKPKDLVGIPWRVAFALQADGWYLRSDIIWAKPNPMPESVTDRPTKAHEYVFLLTKSERYAYHAKAIQEPVSANTDWKDGYDQRDKAARAGITRNGTAGSTLRARPDVLARNARTVWTIATQPYSGAHFATFPEALVERCVLAGSRVGERVFDPFGGSGTVARVALSLGRKAVCTELNPAYLALADERTQVTLGLPLEFTA